MKQKPLFLDDGANLDLDLRFKLNRPNLHVRVQW